MGLPSSGRSVLLRMPEGRILERSEEAKVTGIKSEERKLSQRKAADSVQGQPL